MIRVPASTSSRANALTRIVFQKVSLTLEEYEYMRRIPTHFFVKPGHVYRDVERIVETDDPGDRFEVVEKFGEAGTLAVRLYPRTPQR